jgi:chemosensory pili system protein ChpC
MREDAVTEVRSVLIPLAENRLLLPNVVVAEVMDYQKPEARDNTPEWFIGDLSWRGTRVPVVSIEALMNGSVVTPGRRGRTIVTNTLKPYTLEVDLGVLIKQAVRINGSPALVPNLDELERQVLHIIN